MFGGPPAGDHLPGLLHLPGVSARTPGSPDPPGAGFARKAAVVLLASGPPDVGIARRAKVKVKIRVSNGPLFHCFLWDDYYGAAGVAG